MKKTILVLLTFISATVYGQQVNRFQKDVDIIKSYDQMFTPTAQPIVFTGSSSIRKWDYLQQTFGSYNIINRGVGGTVIDDIIYFADDLIFKYKPRQVVLYVGENDLTDDKKTPDTILNKTIQLFNLIRSRLPEVPIVYISLKPSPSREVYINKCIEVNRLIKNFIEKQSKTVFVDVFYPMLTNGKTRPELFVGDRLHMKIEGYKIWEKAVKPHLLKP